MNQASGAMVRWAVLIVATVIAVMALATHTTVDQWKPEQAIAQVGDKLEVPGSWNQADSASSANEIERTVEALSDHYGSLVEKIDVNISLQAGTMLIGLVLIITRSGRTLEILGVPVSVPWLHLILPLAGIWAWLHWGFLVNNAMRDRALLEVIHSANFIQGTPRTIRYAQSIVLNDCGFMDTWFYSWRTDHLYDMNLNWLAKWFLSGITGIFVGASHAVMVAVLLRGAFCFKQVPTLGAICRWATVCVVLALIASHVFFYLGAGPNGQQPIIALVACALLFFLIRDRHQAVNEGAIS